MIRQRTIRTVERGFTLMEVVLVLTLLVVIGSLSVPYLFGTLSRSKLRNGGDVMLAALTKARLAAMETGQIHIFRCETKGRRFQVGSIGDMSAAGDQADAPITAATPAASGDEDPMSWRLDLKQLPSGVIFAAGDFAPSPQLVAMMGTTDGGGWSNPIVFRPDGTSNDASVLLSNESGQTIRITLRGLTGGIRIGEIGNEPAPPQ